MKAQRKITFNSETKLDSTRRLHCPPDGTDDSKPRVVNKYSPKVLVGEWQTAAALQREYDQWLQRRDCSRCVDLLGAYCTWKPNVVLRRTVRNGGYLYDRPLVPDDDCRLLHRSQLKSLYDQHYNEHPATHPAHVDCPYSLPEGPTNFGLLGKKAAKWQEEIAGLVELRMGSSLYRESYHGHAKDETKGIHVDCKNDFQSSDRQADIPMPNTGSLSTSSKPSTALSKCDNTRDFKVCGKHQNQSLAILPRTAATERDCGSAPAVRQEFENVNPNSNVETELTGKQELKYNATQKNIQKSSPRFELSRTKVSDRELPYENNVPQFECRRMNVPECEFSRWNVPEFESGRKEVRECDFPGRKVSESDFQRENLRDCACPGIQTHPFTENNGAQLRLATGIDVTKSGCARKEFSEFGNDVPRWELDPGIDLQSERRGPRCLPPTPTRFVMTANNRNDACHCCLNPFVF